MLKLSVLLLSISISSFAHNHSGEKFEKTKSFALEQIDKRIAILQESKSCISSASEKKNVKACRKASKEKMKELHETRKEWKKSMKKK